ncbi:NAD(P)H-hydrate epimerase [Patescibacteria group bacterium]|nr:NAD(P)H-hydrate epimerase [Patescibacteria group bacterium]
MIYYATAKEIEKLDDLAVANGLEIRQMMELSGWHILNVFSELKISKTAKVVVACGKGNKGGDGLSATRHLINYGWKVEVVLMSKELAPNAQHQFNLLRKMKAATINYSDYREKSERAIKSSNVIIDALIGYHLKGAPRDNYAEVIRVINSASKKVIAYDIPTGIDATTGECFDPSIEATVTLTLALPKKAFKFEEAKNKSGQIFLADIGIPAFIYDQISPNSRPRFKAGQKSIIKL